MRNLIRGMVCLVFLVSIAASPAWAANHRIGGGLHYWRATDDIDVEGIDEDGWVYVLSYQYRPFPLVAAELDLEISDPGYGGADGRVYAPQAYVLVGLGLYAGLGVGTYFHDGEFDDLFYAARGGVSFPLLLPVVLLDLHVDYRFTEWKGISALADQVSTDVVTVGAQVRVSF